MAHNITHPDITIIPEIGINSTIHNHIIYSVVSGTTSYSDDYGETFTTVSNNLPAYSAISYFVHMTSEDTMIVSRNGMVFRAVYPYSTFTQVVTLANTSSTVRSWGFTEDNDGVLYMSEYGNPPDGSGGYLNIIYWYKSLNDGVSWTRYDNLKTTDTKHIHLIKVNPFTNVLYVTTGDRDKRVFKSTNKGDSWTEVVPTSYPSQTSANINYGGHTGLGFFTNGVILWGTDWQPRNPVNGEYWNWHVRSNGDNLNSFVYDMIPHRNYGMTSEIVVDSVSNIAWKSTRNEFAETDVYPTLMVTYDRGLSWQNLIELPPLDYQARIILSDSHNLVNNDPYIFWVVEGYGVVRIPKTLVPEPEAPQEATGVNHNRYYIREGNVIKEVTLYERGASTVGQMDSHIGISE